MTDYNTNVIKPTVHYFGTETGRIPARPEALGVYIFAGGFTLGVKKHFRVIAHLEDGPYGSGTMRHNQPDVELFASPSTWLEDGRLERFKHMPWIYGNPPCAPWSSAGHLPNMKAKLATHGVAAKYEVDPRVECVRKQFALIEPLQPLVWTWESVARAYTTGRPFVDGLAKRALEMGYAVTLLRIDGALVGLPQHRRRFFFVAHRVEIPWTRPNERTPLIGDVLGYGPDRSTAPYPGASEPHEQHQKRGMGKTIRQYVGLIQPGESATDGWRRWHEQTGEPIVKGDRGQTIGRPAFLCHRLNPHKICGTIVNGGHLIHPYEDRYITVREAQLLSSYPYDYEFVGRNPYSQVSQAVLPRVGEWLARHIRAGIDANIPAAVTLRDVDYLKPPQP